MKLEELIVDGKIQLPDRQSRYTPDLGVIPAGTEVYCGICKCKCNETRDCRGPRSFVQAIGRPKEYWEDKPPTHDTWICPHYASRWHEQAEKLLDMAESTPSKFLEETFQREAAEIIKNQEQSKDWSRFS